MLSSRTTTLPLRSVIPEPPLDLLYRAFEIRDGDYPFHCSLIERRDGMLVVRFSPPIPAWKYAASAGHDIEIGLILLGGKHEVPNDNASLAMERDDGSTVILDKGMVGVAGEKPPWTTPFWELRPMWG